MHCHCEDVFSKFSNAEIQELVFLVLLKRFCMDYYADKAKFVRFSNNVTGEQWKFVNIM